MTRIDKQINYWASLIDSSNNEKQFICENLEYKNITPQMAYWVSLLDESSDEKQFFCEDVEGKNINRAEKWIKQNRPEIIGKEINGRIMSRARDVVTQIRHDIPSARLPYEVDSNGQRKKVKLSNGDIIDKGTCKYLTGVCRIYLNDLPKKTSD